MSDSDDPFRFVEAVPVRMRDLDPMSHVNHAVYASMMEQVRVSYFVDVMGVQPDELQFALASMTIDYRRPLTLESDVTVAVRVPEVGESSFEMAYEVRDGDTVAATGQTTVVRLDPEGGSTPLAESWREAIHEFEPALD
jgi:acyl-CoA thioester hydrolase